MVGGQAVVVNPGRDRGCVPGERMTARGQPALGQDRDYPAAGVKYAQVGRGLPGQLEPDRRLVPGRVGADRELACEFEAGFFFDPGKLGQDEIIGGDLRPRGPSAA